MSQPGLYTEKNRVYLYIKKNNNQKLSLCHFYTVFITYTTYLFYTIRQHSQDHNQLGKSHLCKSKIPCQYSVRRCCCSHFRMFHSHRLMLLIRCILGLLNKTVNLIAQQLILWKGINVFSILTFIYLVKVHTALTHLRVLQMSPMYPESHPVKQVPFTWLQSTVFWQYPHTWLHSLP